MSHFIRYWGKIITFLLDICQLIDLFVDISALFAFCGFWSGLYFGVVVIVFSKLALQINMSETILFKASATLTLDLTQTSAAVLLRSVQRECSGIVTCPAQKTQRFPIHSL